MQSDVVDNKSHKVEICSGIELSEEFDPEFDRKWNETFGEPSTDVFTVDEFRKYMQDVINFE